MFDNTFTKTNYHRVNLEEDEDGYFIYYKNFPSDVFEINRHYQGRIFKNFGKETC